MTSKLIHEKQSLTNNFSLFSMFPSKLFKKNQQKSCWLSYSNTVDMWGRSSTEAFTIAASNNASTAAWTAEGPSARWGKGRRRPRASKFTSKDRGRSCPPHGRSHEGTLQQHLKTPGNTTTGGHLSQAPCYLSFCEDLLWCIFSCNN